MDALGAVPITEDTTGQCNCQIGMLITTKKKKYRNVTRVNGPDFVEKINNLHIKPC